MIRINLLPYREARRLKLLRQILLIWLGVAMVGLVVTLGVDQYFAFTISDLQEVEAKNKETITGLDKQLEEIATIDAKRSAVQSRLDTINNLAKTRLYSAKILDHLARVLPSRIWITTLSTDRAELKITGYSPSNSEVADVMRLLVTSPLLTNVVLSKITQKDVGDVAMSEFSLTATIAYPKADPPAKKDDGAKSKTKAKAKTAKAKTE